MPKTLSRRETKRLQILRSAATPFRQFGYHTTNMDQIAREVGMTKGNLYNYFKDKEEILFFCHEYVMSRLLQLLRNVETSPYPPDVKLRRLVAGFVHIMLDEMEGVFGLEVKELSGERLRKIVVKRDTFERGMRRIIEDGMKEGIFRPGAAKLLTFTILGALNWMSRWYDPHGPAESIEISDTIVECLFNGLLSVERNRRAKTSRRHLRDPLHTKSHRLGGNNSRRVVSQESKSASIRTE